MIFALVSSFRIMVQVNKNGTMYLARISQSLFDMISSPECGMYDLGEMLKKKMLLGWGIKHQSSSLCQISTMQAGFLKFHKLYQYPLHSYYGEIRLIIAYWGSGHISKFSVIHVYQHSS